MKKCLSCDKPCAATSIFCDDCRAQLLSREQQRNKDAQSREILFLPEYVEAAWQARPSFQQFHTATEAVQDHDYPIAPLAKPDSKLDVPPQESDLSHLMPEIWPEMIVDASDASESKPTTSIDSIDPLSQRRLPTSSGSQDAEPGDAAETLQGADHASIAVDQKVSANTLERARVFKKRKRGFTRLRKVFAVLLIIAVLGLLIDGVLLALNYSHHDEAPASESPLLSVTPRVVQRGQMTLLRLSGFPAHSSVFLTHDIQQMLLTDTGSPLVQPGASGDASVPILIEPDWSLGSHTIEAEDVETHYAISTTIQVINGEGRIPACSITASKASLAFSIMAGQARPIMQSVTLSAGKCAAPERWQATSFANWLTVSPSNGQLAPERSVLATMLINGSGLVAGTLSSYVAFTSMQQTQLVTIRLTVLPGSSTSSPGSSTPSPGLQSTPTVTTTVTSAAPTSYTLSPTGLNFTATEGQPDPSGQIVTITNTGSAAISWQATSNGANWLSLSPQQGTLQANQGEQVVVSVNVAQLSTGRYAAQLQVNATGGSGSLQQLASVNVNVLAPCTLQINPARLAFAATTLQVKTGPQKITITEAGNCTQVVSWQASVDQTWASLSSYAGSNAGAITASISELLSLPGTYYAHITFSAASGGSAVTVNPQSVLVTLTVTLL